MVSSPVHIVATDMVSILSLVLLPVVRPFTALGVSKGGFLLCCILGVLYPVL